MSAPNQPENITPENNSNPSPPDPNVSPVTPPSNPPAAQSTNSDALRGELDRLNLGALSELHKENARLQALLAERNATPTTPTPSDDVSAFLANPRQAIRDEMQAIIAPLTQFVGSVKQKTAYDDMKDRFRGSPQLGKLLVDHEDLVDQIMANSEKNEANLQAAIFTAVGLKAAGVVGGSAPATPNPVPPTPTPNPVNNNPPYIPPSPPSPPRNAAPANDVKSKVDALTEQERHIAKVFGMSLEEYVKLRDADSNVSSWSGGAK